MTPERVVEIFNLVQDKKNWSDGQRAKYFNFVKKRNEDKVDSDEYKKEFNSIVNTQTGPLTFFVFLKNVLIHDYEIMPDADFKVLYLDENINLFHKGLGYVDKFNQCRNIGRKKSFLIYLNSDKYLEDVFRMTYMTVNFERYEAEFDHQKLNMLAGFDAAHRRKPKTNTF